MNKKMTNLMKYESIHYVYHTMHIQQLNLILFERNVNYILKVLKRNAMAQSCITTTKVHLVYFDIKEKKKKKRKNTK